MKTLLEGGYAPVYAVLAQLDTVLVYREKRDLINALGGPDVYFLRIPLHYDVPSVPLIYA